MMNTRRCDDLPTRRRSVWIATSLSVSLAATLPSRLLAEQDSAPPAADRIEAAVNKSIRLIELSSAKYLEKRQCFSCHHQAMSVIALSAMREHGFEIDEENLASQIERAARHLGRGAASYRKGRGQGGAVDTAGYALWALEAGDVERNKTTEAVAHYLLVRAKDREHWRRVGYRPPSQASDITTTALALRGLRDFGTEEQAHDIKMRSKKALRWLLDQKPAGTEDRVFHLNALAYLDADRKSIDAAASELVSKQRGDGGWAQTAEMKSDAYATGTALVALARYGGLARDSPAFRRGVRFLLASQKSDGSWHVKSRSKPIQKYFESGFPHGKDQFISMSATCWAALALAMSL